MALNTFPPLVSNESWDFSGRTQLFGNEVLCSCMIRVEPDDTFFNPTTTYHNGFGWNGSLYYGGYEDVNTKSSWWWEGASGGNSNRGPLQTFPADAVVLVTNDGLSILDHTDSFNMWMLFPRATNTAFDTAFGTSGQFSPSTVQYDNGIITVTLTPNAGSTYDSILVLHIDFVLDQIYIDTKI